MNKERANEIMRELKENCEDSFCSECVFYGINGCKLKFNIPRNYKLDILDEKEKEYLSNIVKPFRDRVDFVEKVNGSGKEFIKICLKGEVPINLPYFLKDKMYKGMKTNKDYTLEELGI